MRILLIGGSGFLGSRLVETLNGECNSTYHKRPVSTKQLEMNLTDKRSIRRCLNETQPELIIHCGGLTNSDFCEANKDLALRVNYLGTKKLLENFGGKMIYFSTDYVFDGKKPPYYEDSEPNPINYYGKTKLLAEQEVLKQPQNLVVRVSGLYGFNENNNKFLNNLTKEGKVIASKKLVSTPTYLEDIANCFSSFIDMNGILHFAGEKSFSRYDFVKEVVEVLGLDTKVIAKENNMLAKRPENSSLTSYYDFKKTPLKYSLKEMRRKI